MSTQATTSIRQTTSTVTVLVVCVKEVVAWVDIVKWGVTVLVVCVIEVVAWVDIVKWHVTVLNNVNSGYHFYYTNYQYSNVSLNNVN
jgi:hypothetical protein